MRTPKTILIIDDDVFALALEHNLPSFSTLAPERSCCIAATSEALSGGLRIAYLCPPEHHLEELERTIAARDKLCDEVCFVRIALTRDALRTR